MNFDNFTTEPPRLRTLEKVTLSSIAAFLALCLMATSEVTWSGQLPILNQAFGLQKAIDVGIILSAAILIVLLIGAVMSQRLIPFGRVAALIMVFAGSLELELRIFDRLAISVDHSLVDIASRPVRSGQVEIFLPQSRPHSPLGFRWAHDEPIKKDGYRILLLGNSFVHGSGSSFATNYPQVLEALLRDKFPDRNLTVMPAGVNGYGVVEELQLYRYLTNLGYDFDAVVLNYTTGTDPSQDQAGTKLTVIAGQKQRLHDSLFLRVFYPLDYYILRYMIYFRGVSQHLDAPPEAASDRKYDAKKCPSNPAFEASSHERTQYYYRPGGATRVPIDVGLDALRTLGQEVQANGQKFMAITLPDRNALLASSRDRFQGQTMDWLWIRDRIAKEIGSRWPLDDMSEAYRDRPELFACGDGHWNDDGNHLGATLAAKFLSEQIH